MDSTPDVPPVLLSYKINPKKISSVRWYMSYICS
jgi:hypothetical protein